MKTQLINRTNQRAFTMIEIAISIGVIGFALVAIIGILPRGMNSQKDNREDTIVSQDAPYFMNVIRDGEQRTAGSVLSNYVESVSIAVHNGPDWVTNVFTEALDPLTYDDRSLVGYLSTPEYDPRAASITNEVTAIIRAVSGSALDQNGANSATAFRYQMTVEIDPWSYSAPGYVVNSPNYMNFMNESLHEIRLRFAWPVIEGPNGNVLLIGPNRQTYRSLISSHLTNVTSGPYPLWYFLPTTFFNNTNT